MTALTNAELAILSLVTEKPRHGYEMEQVIEGRGMREWTEVGFSSIYYLLKKLEKDGLVEGQLEQAERGPARKVYRPTPAGWQALHAGVLEALSVPQPCYSPLQLGMANLPGIPPDEAIAALEQYREALIIHRDHVQARRDAQKPLPYFVDAMFDHSITMIETEIAWIGKLIKQVEEHNVQD
jgi:DNA-binding PadR family transcriptional regulator